MKNKFNIIVLSAISILFAYLYFTKENKSETPIKNITIGINDFLGYSPLYLAKEKGFFENINVRIVRIESNENLRSAMKSGIIDMYATSLDMFQSNSYQEPPGVGFLAIDESFGADGIVVTEDINSILDLKGKTIGIKSGLAPYLILAYMLNKEGMTIDDVELIDMSSQAAGDAFVAKQLDAIGIYEPYLSKSVEMRENSKILVSSADIKGIILDVVFANKNLTNNNPEVLKTIAEGWFKAIDYYKHNQEESTTIMANSYGLFKEEMIDAVTGISWLNEEDNKILFDKDKANNIFNTFDLVGDILKKNDSEKLYKVNSTDKITDATINEF